MSWSNLLGVLGTTLLAALLLHGTAVALRWFAAMYDAVNARQGHSPLGMVTPAAEHVHKAPHDKNTQ